MAMIEMSPYELNENVFTLIDKEWALLTAQQGERANPMTVSWGGLGILWNLPVATVYVRPQRFTYPMINDADGFSLTFFDERFRPALNYCGSHSGRDGDKIAHCGLTLAHEGEIPYFQEARLTLICRKIYQQDLKEECFLDPQVAAKNYQKKDFHRMYIGEIVKVLVQEK